MEPVLREEGRSPAPRPVDRARYPAGSRTVGPRQPARRAVAGGDAP